MTFYNLYFHLVITNLQLTEIEKKKKIIIIITIITIIIIITLLRNSHKITQVFLSAKKKTIDLFQ